MDLVFSPVQLLLDLELVRYYRHVVEGFPFAEEAFCMDAIREVGPSGSFLGHETTVTGFREALWESERWAPQPLGRWQSEGSCGFTDRAREEIGALIAQHSFRLPEDQAREIDHLCREAEAALLR